MAATNASRERAADKAAETARAAEQAETAAQTLRAALESGESGEEQAAGAELIALDVEAEAAKIIARRSGSIQDAARTAPRAPVVREEEPELVALRLAKAVQAEELRAKQDRIRAANADRRADGSKRPDVQELRPVRVHRLRRQTADQTAIYDSQGDPAGTPGYCRRWVRTRAQTRGEGAGQPTSARIAEFKQFGYRFILDKHTGQPISSHLGIAMEAPPEAMASRTLSIMPESLLSDEQRLADARAALDEINARAGQHVGDLYQSGEHGAYRAEEDAGVAD